MDFWKKILVFFGVIIVIFLIWIIFFPSGRAVFNNYVAQMQKVDDKTLYEKRKVVEDTCRAMIASYNSDKLTYEQYKDTKSEEKQNWAEQAKMRANKTASTYNSYILQNTFVWKDNIPSDINIKLEIIQ